MDKHKKYRDKMRASGRCPHCGANPEPYTECETRRAQKNKNRNKGVYTIDKYDSRKVPRVGNKPVIYDADFIADSVEFGFPAKAHVFIDMYKESL